MCGQADTGSIFGSLRIHRGREHAVPHADRSTHAVPLTEVRHMPVEVVVRVADIESRTREAPAVVRVEVDRICSVATVWVLEEMYVRVRIRALYLALSLGAGVVGAEAEEMATADLEASLGNVVALVGRLIRTPNVAVLDCRARRISIGALRHLERLIDSALEETTIVLKGSRIADLEGNVPRLRFAGVVGIEATETIRRVVGYVLGRSRMSGGRDCEQSERETPVVRRHLSRSSR